jgi:hypothetical protein
VNGWNDVGLDSFLNRSCLSYDVTLKYDVGNSFLLNLCRRTDAVCFSRKEIFNMVLAV